MLTDTSTVKPGAKPYRRADAGGLYLQIQPTGAKLWRLNYTFAGRQLTAAFGAYPLVSLRAARQARDDAKRLLQQGLDPAAVAREKRAVDRQAVTTFRDVAAEWHRIKNVAEGKAASTITRAEWTIAALNAGIGNRPIAEIEPPDLLAVLRKVEAQGKHETVRRLRSTASDVFRFAIATGAAKRDPAADLEGRHDPGQVQAAARDHRSRRSRPAVAGHRRHQEGS